MAALDDLISQIPDESLRERIRAEMKRANRQKKFGLVFEEHLPEATPLYDIPVKRGSVVAKKDGQVTDIYYVEKIEDGQANCFHKATKERVVLPVDVLVCVAQFGEPIYPYLQPLGTVCNAPDSDLWHTLIEADNYHALQLLEYLYAGKVDCIYIDPPYNTGARDWKYNNDYVDGADTYRHSKWLSMMEKRLQLAKKLLNPNDSVLIVTIDEKEYLHLGCLLEEIFSEARMQMVTSVISAKGLDHILNGLGIKVRQIEVHVVQDIVHLNMHLHGCSDHSAEQLRDIGRVRSTTERHHGFSARAIPAGGEVLLEENHLDVLLVRNTGRLQISDRDTIDLDGAGRLSEGMHNFSVLETESCPLLNLPEAVIQIGIGDAAAGLVLHLNHEHRIHVGVVLLLTILRPVLPFLLPVIGSSLQHSHILASRGILRIGDDDSVLQ